MDTNKTKDEKDICKTYANTWKNQWRTNFIVPISFCILIVFIRRIHQRFTSRYFVKSSFIKELWSAMNMPVPKGFSYENNNHKI